MMTTGNMQALIRAELWSTQLKEILTDELAAQRYVDWLSEFPDGDTFTIPSIGQATVRDYVENDAVVIFKKISRLPTPLWILVSSSSRLPSMSRRPTTSPRRPCKIRTKARWFWLPSFRSSPVLLASESRRTFMPFKVSKLLATRT